MQLALLGGSPAFASPLHVGRPNIGNRETLSARLEDILDQKWLSNDGKYLKQFETKIANLSECKHAIVFTNATVALEWLIRAMDLKGDIIVPAFTFIATAHAVVTAGCNPVFVDVDPETHLISPESIRQALTSKTSAILGVHLWGQPCPHEEIAKIALKASVPVMYDAAHALGCSYQGTPIGKIGCASVYSFHATKFVNSLEGGAIVTDDDQLAIQLRRLRNFGFHGYDNVVNIGTNGKMDEFRAAVGIGSLESMDEFVEINRRNWKLYSAGLEGIAGIELLQYEPNNTSNCQYVVASVRKEATLTRDEILNVLWSENVQARRYFFPGLHRMVAYRDRVASKIVDLPGTEIASREVLVLPTGASIQAGEIEKITSILRAALASPNEVRKAMMNTTLALHPIHPLDC